MATELRTEHEIELRVRYSETDAMGPRHHARCLTWFEIGRTELFRNAELLAEGSSVLACVDRQGELKLIPDDLIGFTQSPGKLTVDHTSQ